jgi:cellulose synthase/poly-beta-1,6-N-acetylglucosamine synthase-like glycosyltransferase
MNLLHILDTFFLVYALALLLIYIGTAVFSALQLNFYLSKNKNVDYHSMLGFERLPSVSIIAPAYNEEKSIVENIRCLLSVYYPKLELIIVNDGSTDSTLQQIIDHYDLVKVDMAFGERIKTAKVHAVYKSLNNAYSNLVVVDKDNGRKADAMNAGINVAKNDLFLATDADCIIEPDAILRMVKPFLEEENEEVVIASGGVIRIANSCEVEDGRIVKVNFPKNFWARFQVLEYFRAFILGRMAWSKINGLLIISGAFGLFDRERVLKIGGYDSSSIGEDLELTLRLRKYMHDVEKRKYRVAFIPDPLCWTEVPGTYSSFAAQRNRWTRGSIDTILHHKKMLLNKKYGIIGLLSFPYWVLFEWFGPIIQVLGLVYFSVLLFLGLVSTKVFFYLLALILAFSVMYSIFSVFFEAFTYDKYKGKKYLGQILLFSVLEMFIFQPINALSALKGNFAYFIQRKKGWGVMTRTGFNSPKVKTI